MKDAEMFMVVNAALVKMKAEGRRRDNCRPGPRMRWKRGRPSKDMVALVERGA